MQSEKGVQERDGLCFINANGGGFEFYPLDDLNVGGVKWSPDGKNVLFTYSRIPGKSPSRSS